MPMDFVVLEIKGVSLRNREHMILLGRPFMVTTKTGIDLQSGKLTMTISGETVQLKVANSSQHPFATFHSQWSFVDFIDLLISNPFFKGIKLNCLGRSAFQG